MPGAAAVIIMLALFSVIRTLGRVSKPAGRTAAGGHPAARVTADADKASAPAPAAPAPAPAAAPGPAPRAARPGPAPRMGSAFETFDTHEGPPPETRLVFSEAPRTPDVPHPPEAHESNQSGELLKAVIMSEVLKRPIERRRIPYGRR